MRFTLSYAGRGTKLPSALVSRSERVRAYSMRCAAVSWSSKRVRCGRTSGFSYSGKPSIMALASAASAGEPSTTQACPRSL